MTSKQKKVRFIAGAALIAFALIVTWPGFTLLNRVEPLVLGVPFNLFAIALLILLAMGGFIVLHFSENGEAE